MDWRDQLNWFIMSYMFTDKEQSCWKELAETYGVSESTIRERKETIRETKEFRDLRELVINTVSNYMWELY